MTDTITLSRETFDRQIHQSEVPVLVDFWASWCRPCQLLAPAIDTLASEYRGRAVVAKLDVDDNPEIAAEYGVQSVPTLILFSQGQEVDRIHGAVRPTELQARLAQQVSRDRRK